jgi:DNA invertase Pin-like site-specific DNA recombinase
MEQAVGERKIRIIPAVKPQTQTGRSFGGRKQRVAAYCRVSTDSEEQLTSYTAQKAYYTQKIEENPNWEMAGIYADRGITGTSLKKRTEFNKMIAACKRGRIDLILTKSLSRFARNTVDCLDTVRMLKGNGIGVIFEKENINTLTETSEFLITLFSGFAQAESESISKNVVWGIQKSREAGKVPFQYKKMLGYRKGEDGQPEIVPEEAETVKRIYRRYLDGCSLGQIKLELEADHVPTAEGIQGWSYQVLRNILSNERYIGDALLQKTYITDCISKTVRKNEGERPMVYVENNHPAIIPKGVFYQVREEMTRRTSKRKVMQKSAKTELGKYSAKYALSELLVCGECGTPYKRCTWARNGKKRIVWRCVSRLEFGKKYCHNSPTLDEEKLHRAILEAINEIAPNHSEAVSAVLDLINTVCSGTQDGRPSLLELKNRLAALTIQQSQVMEQVLEDMENTELNARLRALTEEKETLQMEIEATQADERQRTEQDIRMEELGTFLTNTSAQITEYEDEIVRKMIEKITVVDVETIRIRFKTLESEIEKKMV